MAPAGFMCECEIYYWKFPLDESVGNLLIDHNIYGFSLD